jgi:hypothetical protein
LRKIGPLVRSPISASRARIAGAQHDGGDLAALAADAQYPVAVVGAVVAHVGAEHLGDARAGEEEDVDQGGQADSLAGVRPARCRGTMPSRSRHRH